MTNLKAQLGSTILGFSFVIILVVGICGGALVGYGLNIYKLTQCDFESSYKAEVFRTIGLFPLAGVFMGYIDIKDGNTKEGDK